MGSLTVLYPARVEEGYYCPGSWKMNLANSLGLAPYQGLRTAAKEVPLDMSGGGYGLMP